MLDTMQKDKLVKDLGVANANLLNAQSDIAHKDTKLNNQKSELDNKDNIILGKDNKIAEDKGKIHAAMEKSISMQQEMFNLLTKAGVDPKGVETMFQTFNASIFSELGDLYTPPEKKEESADSNSSTKNNQ